MTTTGMRLPTLSNRSQDFKNAMKIKKPGFQMLNDDEIVTSVQAEPDPVDQYDETDKDEDNNNESCKGPSNAGTFSVLKTAMEWYEQQSECCPTRLLLLKRIRDLAAKNLDLQWYSEKCDLNCNILHLFFFFFKHVSRMC
ncbi:uncharacterized protein TNCV_3404551 [Trichonephila clavipes]|nr:uncharacterized protein TNCV_3404551 [Trichonephila clavipes]